MRPDQSHSPSAWIVLKRRGGCRHAGRCDERRLLWNMATEDQVPRYLLKVFKYCVFCTLVRSVLRHQNRTADRGRQTRVRRIKLRLSRWTTSPCELWAARSGSGCSQPTAAKPNPKTPTRRAGALRRRLFSMISSSQGKTIRHSPESPPSTPSQLDVLLNPSQCMCPLYKTHSEAMLIHTAKHATDNEQWPNTPSSAQESTPRSGSLGPNFRTTRDRREADTPTGFRTRAVHVYMYSRSPVDDRRLQVHAT